VTSAATTYCSVSGRPRRTPRARPAATRAPFIQSMAARCRGGMKGGRRFACVRTACRPHRRGDGVNGWELAFIVSAVSFIAFRMGQEWQRAFGDDA